LSDQNTRAKGLPYEISEAVVQVCGLGFWFRDPFIGFLRKAGISKQLIDRFEGESKYKMTRHILAELEGMGEDGWLIQRRLLTELCQLRKVPDENAQDAKKALEALRRLKELAIAHGELVEVDRTIAQQRVQEVKLRQEALHARQQKTAELRELFYELAKGTDLQARGYSLERLMGDLFTLNEIPYRPSYRTGVEQVDGHFNFEGFDYLVEARWRSGVPDHSDLAAFKSKVDGKIASTRGMFFSIAGFRPEVVSEFGRRAPTNVVLVAGEDLILILEGQVSLRDALLFKIRRAAQEGIMFAPLRERFN
jgi:hypothetical protein